MIPLAGSQPKEVLREHAIGMLIAGMSTRAVARKCNVNFSNIKRLQHHFREFGSTSNRPHNRRRRVSRVGKRFAEVNDINRVPHGVGGVMVWAGIYYGQ